MNIEEKLENVDIDDDVVDSSDEDLADMNIDYDEGDVDVEDQSDDE